MPVYCSLASAAGAQLTAVLRTPVRSCKPRHAQVARQATSTGSHASAISMTVSCIMHSEWHDQLQHQYFHSCRARSMYALLSSVQAYSRTYSRFVSMRLCCLAQGKRSTQGQATAQPAARQLHQHADTTRPNITPLPCHSSARAKQAGVQVNSEPMSAGETGHAGWPAARLRSPAASQLAAGQQSDCDSVARPADLQQAGAVQSAGGLTRTLSLLFKADPQEGLMASFEFEEADLPRSPDPESLPSPSRHFLREKSDVASMPPAEQFDAIDFDPAPASKHAQHRSLAPVMLCPLSQVCHSALCLAVTCTQYAACLILYALGFQLELMKARSVFSDVTELELVSFFLLSCACRNVIGTARVSDTATLQINVRSSPSMQVAAWFLLPIIAGYAHARSSAASEWMTAAIF